MVMRTANNSLAENAVLITPSDSSDISGTSSGLQVNVSGDVKMTFFGGGEVTLYLIAGVAYPYRVTRVWLTDTNATGIHALY